MIRQPTPVLFPGKNPMDRGAWWAAVHGVAGLNITEWLHFHFSLSSTGEGNGNPLQCSCLENPRDWEPGGLPSLGSHRVGHDWSDLESSAAAAAGCWSCKWKGRMGERYTQTIKPIGPHACLCIEKCEKGKSQRWWWDYTEDKYSLWHFVFNALWNNEVKMMRKQLEIFILRLTSVLEPRL